MSSLMRHCLVAAFCGLSLGLPFTYYEGSLPVWFALAPVLWLVVRAQSATRAAVISAAFALAWTVPSFTFFWHLTFVGALALCLYTSLFYVAGLLLIRRLATGGLALAIFGSAAVWVLVELARSMVPVFGFPWLLLGHALLDHQYLRQAADLAGVYGLSFMLVSVNAALAFAVPAWFKATWQAVPAAPRACELASILVALLWALTGLYGQLRVTQLSAQLQPGPTIAVVQGNIAQKLGRTHEEMLDQVFRHSELHQMVVQRASLQGQPPALVCWAETMLPSNLRDPLGVMVQHVVSRAGVPTVVGAEHLDADAPEGARSHNSALVLEADGRQRGQYFKRRLVPFGEYIPFTATLPFLKILKSVTRDQYEPGAERSAIFELGGYRFALNLCIEDIHPGLAREAAWDGADSIINLTNDGWFYGTYGPTTHLRAAAWRAIEVRRPLLRVTNTGHSVAVDPLGRVGYVVAPETEGVGTVALLRLQGDGGRTWSMVLGEWGCATIMLGLVLVLWRFYATKPAKSSSNS